MPEYEVRWRIEIEAKTPLEAARKALAIQRDPDSLATVFDVYWTEANVEVDAAQVKGKRHAKRKRAAKSNRS